MILPTLQFWCCAAHGLPGISERVAWGTIEYRGDEVYFLPLEPTPTEPVLLTREETGHDFREGGEVVGLLYAVVEDNIRWAFQLNGTTRGRYIPFAETSGQMPPPWEEEPVQHKWWRVSFDEHVAILRVLWRDDIKDLHYIAHEPPAREALHHDVVLNVLVQDAASLQPDASALFTVAAEVLRSTRPDLPPGTPVGLDLDVPVEPGDNVVAFADWEAGHLTARIAVVEPKGEQRWFERYDEVTFVQTTHLGFIERNIAVSYTGVLDQVPWAL